MRYKRIFLLFLIFIFKLSVLEARTNDAYLRRIFELTEQDYNLGVQIVDRLNFKVFQEQFLRKGDTLKYVLEGSDGQLYLFKTYTDYEEENAVNNVFGSKFSAFCGIPAVESYVLWLPFNWDLVYGDVQKIVKDLRDFSHSDVPEDRNWLKYYLFRWLLDDPSPDFYLLPDGSIINIDLDKIRNTEGMDFKDFDYGNFTQLLKVCLREGKFEEPFKEALSFIDYVESLPETTIIDLFGPYAFDERVRAFNARRNKLRAEFIKYCRETAREAGVKFSFNTSFADGNSYARRVLSGLARRIADKRKALKNLPEETVLKTNLELISTQNGISHIDFSKVPVDKLSLLVNQRIETLKNLRKETSNTYERMALSLYINRYRQFLPYLECGILPPEEVQFVFSPLELEARTIEANLKLGAMGNEDRGFNFLPPDIARLSLDGYYENYIRDNANRKKSDSEWNYIMNGNCYLFKLELEKALSEYSKVITMGTADREALFLAHILSGFIYELNNDYIRFGQGWQAGKAEEEFRLALKIDPGSNTAKTNLQVIDWLKNTGRESCVSGGPLDAEGHYVMALFSIIKKQYAPASEHIEKADALGFDKGLLEDARAELEKCDSL